VPNYYSSQLSAERAPALAATFNFGAAFTDVVCVGGGGAIARPTCRSLHRPDELMLFPTLERERPQEA